MGYFPVRYDFRVVIYERKMSIRLSTDDIFLNERAIQWKLDPNLGLKKYFSIKKMRINEE